MSTLQRKLMIRGWSEHVRACASWIRNNISLLWGVYKVNRLPEPRVSFFGGSHAKSDSRYAQQARELALKCADARISILTGGGPGIMEAAGCSRPDYPYALGIGLRGLIEKQLTVCHKNVVITDSFAARKWLLMQYSQVFLIFPGGFGTLDEAFALLTLVQTGFLPKVTIIFFDREYWAPILNWVSTKAIPQGFILPEESSLYVVIDDVDQAFSIIKKACHGDACK